MALQTISEMSLENRGGFIAKIKFQYMDSDGNVHTTDAGPNIVVTETQTANPGVYGVPEGATVWLYVDVFWGTDNIAQEHFQYSRESPNTAAYKITGTIWQNSLSLMSLPGWS